MSRLQTKLQAQRDAETKARQKEAVLAMERCVTLSV